VTDPAAAERIKKFYAEVAITPDSFARAVAYAISERTTMGHWNI
jgi:NADP-dependent 3-hydroxy acid dehydrogenase YdfG